MWSTVIYLKAIDAYVISCRYLYELFNINLYYFSGYWIPGPTPNIREVAHLSLVNQEELSENKQRMNFILTGSYQLSVQIRPKDGVILEYWSLFDSVPPEMVYNNQTFYFIMITHGMEEEFLNFTLHFHVRLIIYKINIKLNFLFFFFL